ncbi:MAG: GNAT family N-acetyltransferase [bacterium]
MRHDGGDAAVAVRQATGADVEALVGLAVGLRDHLGQTVPRAAAFHDAFARLIASGAARFFVAGADCAAALGYVQCRYRDSAWSGGVDIELEDVFVAAASRRGGVGRALLEYVLADAQRRGCRIAGLTTNERNAPALALYGRLGFVAERARWHGGRQLWLERRLAPA